MTNLSPLIQVSGFFVGRKHCSAAGVSADHISGDEAPGSRNKERGKEEKHMEKHHWECSIWHNLHKTVITYKVWKKFLETFGNKVFIIPLKRPVSR